MRRGRHGGWPPRQGVASSPRPRLFIIFVCSSPQNSQKCLTFLGMSSFDASASNTVFGAGDQTPDPSPPLMSAGVDRARQDGAGPVRARLRRELYALLLFLPLRLGRRILINLG